MPRLASTNVAKVAKMTTQAVTSTIFIVLLLFKILAEVFLQ